MLKPIDENPNPAIHSHSISGRLAARSLPTQIHEPSVSSRGEADEEVGREREMKSKQDKGRAGETRGKRAKCTDKKKQESGEKTRQTGSYHYH